MMKNAIQLSVGDLIKISDRLPPMKVIGFREKTLSKDLPAQTDSTPYVVAKEPSSKGGVAVVKITFSILKL